MLPKSAVSRQEPKSPFGAASPAGGELRSPIALQEPWGQLCFRETAGVEYKSRIFNRYLGGVQLSPQHSGEWSTQAPHNPMESPPQPFYNTVLTRHKSHEAVNLHVVSRKSHLYNHSTLDFLFHIVKIQNIQFLSSVLQKQEGFPTCTNATVVPLFKHGLLRQLMVMTDKADKMPLDCWTHCIRQERLNSTLTDFGKQNIST